VELHVFLAALPSFLLQKQLLPPKSSQGLVNPDNSILLGCFSDKFFDNKALDKKQRNPQKLTSQRSNKAYSAGG